MCMSAYDLWVCISGAAPARLTSKVGAVRKLGFFIAFGQYADNSMLYEVHFLANGPLPDDVIPRLEHLEL